MSLVTFRNIAFISASGSGRPCPCEPRTQLWTLKTEGHTRTVTLLKVWNKQCSYTLYSEKKTPILFIILHNNFGKSGPIFIIFSLLNSKKVLRRKIVLTVPPPLKSVITLPCETKWSIIQLYSAVNPVQNDEKRLIMVTVHSGCYFFVFLHRLILSCA